MDDQLLSMLGRSLHGLVRDAPGLDDLMVPRQASSGENAGKPPARRGSRPPVVMGVLDLKLQALATFEWWCAQLRASRPELDPPESRTLGGMAAWVHSHILVLEEQPWADLCAQELVSTSRLVCELVSPPPRAGDPQPVEWGSLRVVESWCRHLGVLVSKSTIHRWAKRGEIEVRTGAQGEPLVSLEEVMGHARTSRSDLQVRGVGQDVI